VAKAEGGKVGKQEVEKVRGKNERCALRAFHLKSASLETTFRTECQGGTGSGKGRSWEGENGSGKLDPSSSLKGGTMPRQACGRWKRKKVGR
jgi:hypothetical protein